MLSIKTGKKHMVLLYTVYLVYLLYYLADMNTSSNTLVKQTSERTSVHYYLVLLIGILGLYLISHRTIMINDKFRYRFFLLIIWGFIVDLINGTAFWAMATHIGLMVLFYLASYFCSVYVDSEDKYNRIILFEYILWIITMYYGVRAYFSYSRYIGTSTNVLNMAYNVLVFFPLLLQLHNRKIKNISILISIVYVIVSLKRGAILAMLSMIIVYFFNIGTQSITGKISTKKIFVGIIASLGLVIIVLVVNNEMNGALLNRFSADELRSGSTRNIIYSNAISVIKDRGLLSLLIGTGSGSTMTLIGSGAHNEELELVISYGIVGIFLYFIALIGGVLQFKLLKGVTISELQPTIYMMSLSYIILVGLVGSALFSHMTYHLMIAMGLANSTYVLNCNRKECMNGE